MFFPLQDPPNSSPILISTLEDVSVACLSALTAESIILESPLVLHVTCHILRISVSRLIVNKLALVVFAICSDIKPVSLGTAVMELADVVGSILPKHASVPLRLLVLNVALVEFIGVLDGVPLGRYLVTEWPCIR